MATQTVIDWINSKSTEKYKTNSFEQAESFFLLWNVFEQKVSNGSGRSLGLENIERYIKGKSISIDNSTLISYLKHFQNRYIENGKTKSNFKSLFIRSRDEIWGKKLEKILLSDLSQVEDTDKIIGMSIIASRIRNKSFHGEKGIIEIMIQEDTFQHLNNFLMNFLDQLIPSINKSNTK